MHEGGSIWKNIQGVMATDLLNIYKYGFERCEHIIVPELVGSKYFSTDSKFFENFSQSSQTFRLTDYFLRIVRLYMKEYKKKLLFVLAPQRHLNF